MEPDPFLYSRPLDALEQHPPCSFIAQLLRSDSRMGDPERGSGIILEQMYVYESGEHGRARNYSYVISACLSVYKELGSKVVKFYISNFQRQYLPYPPSGFCKDQNERLVSECYGRI